MLPAPAAGSAEEIILSKQSPVQRAKATEFTVMLQLTRARLEALMENDATLAAACKRNLTRWMEAVRPAQLRQMGWLFNTCPADLLTLLSPMWKIGAVPEGHCLIDGDAGSWGGETIRISTLRKLCTDP